jgi:glycosyltransferase involved in cell wall biosynthesis
MHVLFLSSWYPEHEASRNGIFIFRQAEALSGMGVQTGLIAAVSSPNDQPEIRQQNMAGVAHVVATYHAGYLAPLQGWRYLQAMQKAYLAYIKQHGHPDLLLVQVAWKAGWFALWLHYTRSMPYVLVEHWSGYLPQSGYTMPWPRKYLTRLICDRAEWVAAVSQTLATGMQQGAYARKVRVLPNLVNTQVFRPQPERTRVSKGLFLHVSNLVPVKNFALLLEAFAAVRKQMPNAQLLVAGAFEPTEVKNEFAGPWDGVNLLGVQTAESLAVLCAQVSALVLCSWSETFSIVVPEAMACGCEVITFPLPAVMEHAGLGKMTLVNNYQPENWAAAMLGHQACLTNEAINEQHQMVEAAYGKLAVGRKWMQFLKPVANVD